MGGAPCAETLFISVYRENEGTTYNLKGILYSVYAALSVCCIWCQLMMMAWRDGEG